MLFLKYIIFIPTRPKDHGLIRRIFTDCDFQYVPDAGHWVHSEKPHEFLEIVLKFINNNK